MVGNNPEITSISFLLCKTTKIFFFKAVNDAILFSGFSS